MDSTISKFFKFFSNWFIYLLGLFISGGLGYYLFKVNQVIQVQNVSSFSDLHNIAVANPDKFFPALGALLLFLFLAFFVVPITFKRFFKVHIVVPLLLVAGSVIGYYLGYGLYVFISNIVILILTVIIVTFTVLVSLPNNN